MCGAAVPTMNMQTSNTTGLTHEMSAKATPPGEFKLFMDVVKGRIASSFPTLSEIHEHRVWHRLEQNVSAKAASICHEIVQQAQNNGTNLTSEWFCDRRSEIFHNSIPDHIRASLNLDSNDKSADSAFWNRLAESLLSAAKTEPEVVVAAKPAAQPAMVPVENKDVQPPAERRGEDMEDEKVAESAQKRSRDEFEADCATSAGEPIAKVPAVAPIKDEDDAAQSAGGRMRAEEHRRRQVNSEMLNALRSELPERDRAAFTGGNNSTVNTLSHAIDFIQKLKEKKARCLQELALLDGADMGMFADSAPAIVHPLQHVSQQAQQHQQMNLARMMPPPMGNPQMGLEAFMGLGVHGVSQPQASNHRVQQYLKIAQVSALTLECLAFSNPSAWLTIGNVSVGSGVLAVHESNGLCGRIVGEIGVPFATVLKRLQERDWHQHIPDWSPCTVHSSSTVEAVGPGTGVYKTTLSSPSAPNSVLEVCQIRHVMASTTVQGRLILSFTSTSHDSPALNPSADTAQMNPSGCILEATPDGNGCKIVVVMDLGPGWGAAEGIVQQMLRSNFQATAQMALHHQSPAASGGQNFMQPQLLNMVPASMSGQHPYHSHQHMDEKIVRANSFPSLCLGTSGPLGLATRAPSAQDDMAWNMPSTGIEVRGGNDNIMDILKRAGKHKQQELGSMPTPGSEGMKRSKSVLSGVLQQQQQQR